MQDGKKERKKENILHKYNGSAKEKKVYLCVDLAWRNMYFSDV